MKILLIAPADDSLPGLDSEIASIVSHHEVVVLAGEVRDQDIADAILAHPEEFDCLWICSHGSGIGIQITGDVLTADGVGQYLTATRSRLCVLNSCASESLARQIIVGTDSDIIFTVSDVLDGDALRFGALLASELAKTDNYREAFNHAAPQRGKYKYLSAKAAIRALDQTVSGELQKLAARVDEGVKSYQKMNEITYKMSVDAEATTTRVSDLSSRLVAMQIQLDLLKQAVTQRDMRDDLRKEERNMEMGAMGRRIDNNQQQGGQFGQQPQQPTVVPTLTVTPVGSRNAMLIGVVVLSVLVAVGIMGIFYLIMQGMQP